MQPLRRYKLLICCNTLEAIACLVFELPKSKILNTFNGFLKMAISYSQYISKEAEGVMGATPQKVWVNALYYVKHKNDMHTPAALPLQKLAS